MAAPAPVQSVPTLIQRVWQAPWLWMALVVVLFCIPLFVGLGGQDLDSDESIYSFSIQTMLRDGDWLTPKSIPSDTEPWLEKPPLKFWIVALPIHWGLLPSNEFGLRFWDALMGSVAFLYVFAIGRRIGGPVCGVGAVFLLFIHAQLVFQHGLRTNNMESALFLAYAAGMYHFLAWRAALDRPSSIVDRRSFAGQAHLMAIALYFVLGFMTKFVAVLFLPLIIGLTIGGMAITSPDDRQRLWMSWRTLVWAAALTLALIAPWFVYQYIAFGPRLIDVMFGTHVLQRFTATLDPRHLHPWHFYFSELWRELQANGTGLLTLAGAVLLLIDTLRVPPSLRSVPCGLPAVARSAKVGSSSVASVAIALWFVVPITLMSFGTSKLYHYAYPFLPPVGIAGGYAAARVAAWLWRAFARPAELLESVRRRRLPEWTRSAAVRMTATTIGAIALLVAIATGLLGRVRLAIGDIAVLRNGSVVRSALLWATTWLVAAPASLVQSIVPVAALLILLPYSGYRATLDRMRIVDRPVSDVAACLTDVVTRRLGEGHAAPGVWVAPTLVSHRYAYYLHALGPWEPHESATPAAIRLHLSPERARPVLLSLEQAAGLQKELDGIQTRVGAFEHAGLVLLLPGAFAACAPSR